MRPRASCRRAGFTLIEVLVSIGIIGVLAGLTLPAVQSAREAARRAQCANNLKQIITATQTFAADQGGFPGSSLFRPSDGRPVAAMQCLLLPYLEQRPLSDSLNFTIPSYYLADFPPENATATAQTVAVFLCPSDPYTTAAPYGCNSYRANLGLGEEKITPPSDSMPIAVEMIWSGAFIPTGRPMPLAEFTDGLSNTLAFSEKKVSSGRYDPSRDWINGGFVADSADAWVENCSHLYGEQGAVLTSGRSWLISGGRCSTFFTSAPPNSPVPDCGGADGGGWGLFAARSYHRGGVNAALADGSVRWFSSGIAVRTWRALGTRKGGEVTAGD